MNVFNLISVGGGKSEGLYVWKKYELKWILEDTTLGYGGKIIYENVDRCIVYKSRTPKAENGKVVFDSASVALDTTTSTNIYIANDLHNEYFMYVGDDEKAFYVSSSESQYPGYLEYSASSKKVTISAGANASYPLHILSPKLTAGDMVGYVVSDKDDTYPDKEVEDGYYYEKITLVTLANFGCTKYEVGSLNFTSSLTSTRVNHSLGIVPKFVALFRTDDRSAYLSHSIYTFTPSGTYGGGADASMETSINAMSETGSTASTTNVYLSTVNTSSFRLYGSFDYIILA